MPEVRHRQCRDPAARHSRMQPPRTPASVRGCGTAARRARWRGERERSRGRCRTTV